MHAPVRSAAKEQKIDQKALSKTGASDKWTKHTANTHHVDSTHPPPYSCTTMSDEVAAAPS